MRPMQTQGYLLQLSDLQDRTIANNTVEHLSRVKTAWPISKNLPQWQLDVAGK